MNLPKGWPTPEMIEAAKDARLTIPEEALPGKVCRIIFEAMIAAAPVPEVEPAGFVLHGDERPRRVFWVNEPPAGGTNLYAHPAPPSELVKAAEDMVRFADIGDDGPLPAWYVFSGLIENLRTALKTECPAPAPK